MSHDIPHVSFIMPAYNVEFYIREAIQSIQNQTYTNWELIIIDDGSRDATLRIVEKIANKDDRIKILQMPSHSGSAYQPRKYGISHALAPLIAPIDADDFVDPSYLQNLLTLMDKNGADIVFPTMYTYSASNISLHLPQDKWLLEKPMKGKDCVKFTLFEWQIGCNGGIIKKDLYQKAFSNYDSSISYACADELLVRQLLVNADTISLSSEKYYYRYNPDSITTKISKKKFDFLINNLELLDFIKEFFSEDSIEYQKAQRQNLHGIFGTLKIFDKINLSKDEKKNIISKLKEAKSKIDYKILNTCESNKYLWLSRLNINNLGLILRSYDSVKKNLKRILYKPKRWLTNYIKFIDKLNQVRLLSKGIYIPGHQYQKFYEDNYLSTDINYSNVKEGIICMCDGKFYHGGLTDRLRGILTVYKEAKKRKIPFYIYWSSPFQLEDYLSPNNYDWRINEADLIFDKNYSFPFFNDDETNFFSALRMKYGLKLLKPQIHVYSNADNALGEYRQLYNELFKPSEILLKNFQKYKNILGEHYDAYTFRFLQLLGDFHDWNSLVLPEKEAEELMEKCWKELSKLINKEKSSPKILITSDSKKFLDFIKDKDSRIFILPGDIKHIDLTQGKYDDAWIKTFTDQHFLMNANKVTRMRTGKMYKSGFPRFAAEVGGTKFVDHKF